MKTHRFIVAVLAVSAVVAATSCRPKEEKTGTISAQEAKEAQKELPPDVLAQLDSGNEAFRAGDHKAALDHYTKAKDLKSDVAAAWFGIYMAQQALGNEDAAKEALARAQKISPGATLLHPATTDTMR